MTCDVVTMPDGGTAIVCSRSRAPVQRCRCGNRATLLCDWKVSTNKSGTCDAPLCRKCTTSPAPEKDLCQVHADAYTEWKARQ